MKNKQHFETSFDKQIINKKDLDIEKPILSYKEYSQKNNFSIQLFRAEAKDTFYARKRALMAHSLVCTEAFCQTCDLGKKVRAFQYILCPQEGIDGT